MIRILISSNGWALIVFTLFFFFLVLYFPTKLYLAGSVCKRTRVVEIATQNGNLGRKFSSVTGLHCSDRHIESSSPLAYVDGGNSVRTRDPPWNYMRYSVSGLTEPHRQPDFLFLFLFLFFFVYDFLFLNIINNWSAHRKHV